MPAAKEAVAQRWSHSFVVERLRFAAVTTFFQMVVTACCALPVLPLPQR